MAVCFGNDVRSAPPRQQLDWNELHQRNLAEESLNAVAQCDHLFLHFALEMPSAGKDLPSACPVPDPILFSMSSHPYHCSIQVNPMIHVTTSLHCSNGDETSYCQIHNPTQDLYSYSRLASSDVWHILKQCPQRSCHAFVAALLRRLPHLSHYNLKSWKGPLRSI